MLSLLAALVAGYVLGSLPSAQLVARLKGQSIFSVGSGNMGAMNTARNLGYGLGALVLLLDIGKGTLASFIGLTMAQMSGQTGLLALGMGLAAGLGAVIGHAYSVFVGFKGGKALATGFGTSLPVYPLAGLFGLGLLIALILILRRSNLGAAVAVALYPFTTLAVLGRQGVGQDARFAIFSVVLLIAIVIFIKYLPLLRQGEAKLF